MGNAYIGVRGAKRSGKDTFTNYLVSELVIHLISRSIVRTSFAKNLRLAVAQIFGFDPEFVFSDEFKPFVTHVYPLPGRHMFDEEKPLTGRELLQYFGSEVCREMDNDCWARAPFTEVEREHDNALCFITDLRFPNEADQLLQHHSFIIKVERPGFDGDGHISERALDDFEDDDFIVDNSGTEEDLANEAKKIAAVIAERLTRGD